MSQALNLEFRSNSMLVDSSYMTPQEYSPREFETVLRYGREAILGAIQAFHVEMINKNPDLHIQRPSIAVMNLGRDTDRHPVLSDLGREYGTGWYQDRGLIAPRVHPYWDRIPEVQLIPEVRLMAFGKQTYNALFVRDTAYEA